jgi:multiple sugar transport system permease protein
MAVDARRDRHAPLVPAPPQPRPALWRAPRGWYRRHNRLGDLSTAIVCLAPAIVILGVFSLYPIVYSGYLSLVKWDGLAAERPFVWFDNYVRLTRSGLLGNAIEVTLVYAAGVTALSLTLGLLTALLLNTGVRGLTLYRTIYFLPVVTATVAVAIVWKLLLDPGSGYVNIVLREVGIIAPSWLRDPTWALPAVMLVGVWKRLGFTMVVYLAGLQAVPREIQEAAEVDGAGRIAVLRDVTLPLLAPTTLLLAIMGIIDAFLVFDQIYVMTGGGPIGRTEVLGLLLYRQAFDYFDLGGASAIGWVMFALIASVSLVQWRLLRAGTKEVGT